MASLEESAALPATLSSLGTVSAVQLCTLEIIQVFVFQCFHLYNSRKERKINHIEPACCGGRGQPLAPVIKFKDIYDLLFESLQSKQCCFSCSLAKNSMSKQRLCGFP